MAVSRAVCDERASSTASGTQQQVSRCTLWLSQVEKGAFRFIITIFVLFYKVCVAVAFCEAIFAPTVHHVFDFS